MDFQQTNLFLDVLIFSLCFAEFHWDFWNINQGLILEAEPHWNIIFVRMQILIECNQNFYEKGLSLGWRLKFMNTGDIKVNRKVREVIRSRKPQKNLKCAPRNCKGGRFCAVLHSSYIYSCFNSQGGEVFTLPYVCLLRTSQTVCFFDNVF